MAHAVDPRERGEGGLTGHAPELTMPGTTCRECGEVVSATWLTCKRCGAERPAPVAAGDARPRAARWSRVVAIVIVVVLAAGSAALAFSGW